MSLTEITTKNTPSGSFLCSRCNSPIPEQATFCSACGERVDKNSQVLAISSEFTNRYRITSLVRRSSYIQLFLAIDTIHQCPVVIRDIEISDADDEIHTQAIDIVQREYDLLRRQHIPDVLSAIDLHYSPEHLLVIQKWPFPVNSENGTRDALTLHDLIQSGVGLPDEETAIAWIYRLSNALQRLHSHQIVIGDLDPHLIAVSESDYSGQPALMVSWLPTALRKLLPDSAISKSATGFIAPETRAGIIDPRSDIYSLGAILYLLLTGTAPTTTFEEEEREIRPPRELNLKISSRLEAVVMRALEYEQTKRFATTEGFADALLRLDTSLKSMRLGPKTSEHRAIKQPVSPKAQETKSANPDEDDDKTIVIRPRDATQARHLREQLANHTPIPQKQSPDQSKRSDNHTKAKQTEEKQLPAIIPQKERPIEEQSTVTISQKEVLDGIAEARARKKAAAPLAVPPTEQTARKEQADGRDGARQQKQSLPPRLLQRFADILPALSSLNALVSLPRRLPARLLQPATAVKSLTAPVLPKDRPLLHKLQQIFLGEQQHSTTAVVLIETPLGVQPQQHYHLRISVMGRDEPGLPPGAPPDMELSGLSALAQGDRVHIEVRASLIQNYTYILQQADVEIPQSGYAAEVTIPMQTLSDRSGGRRERLYISLMDGAHQPLYEKPFVVEVFISTHVQTGREGHNVLTIPL